MWPPAGAEGQELVLSSTWEQPVCTRAALSLFSRLTSRKGPSSLSAPLCHPYGESVYTTHFHFASTWRLLLFSRASCFLSYRILFMLDLGKLYLHSRHALPSWWVSISYFHPTWSKRVVLWNKQGRPKLGQARCVPTQGVTSIRESPLWGMLSLTQLLFEMVRKSKENLDKRNKVHTSEICGFRSELILPQEKNWAWYLKDSIHLETIIK